MEVRSVCASTDAMCTQKCNANEQKWIVRIVLKDMKVPVFSPQFCGRTLK